MTKINFDEASAGKVNLDGFDAQGGPLDADFPAFTIQNTTVKGNPVAFLCECDHGVGVVVLASGRVKPAIIAQGAGGGMSAESFNVNAPALIVTGAQPGGGMGMQAGGNPAGTFRSTGSREAVSAINDSGGHGIYSESTGGDGVQGVSHSKNHSGVAAINDGGGYGVWAKGAIAGHFEGNIHVTGDVGAHDVVLSGGDCAEEFEVANSETVEAGTVVVIDQDSKLAPSSVAYDKRVAGVISGAGDLFPGIVLGSHGELSGAKRVALVGRVYCKVDATHDPIGVGDLLTTSPSPGHAMRAAEPLKAFGAVIGKALQPLNSGRGLIPIIVALQ
jgi:hypothetical protein